MENMKCAKCKGEMEEGLIPETNQVGRVRESIWITKISFMKGMENKHSIATFRCKACGYLESYAK